MRIKFCTRCGGNDLRIGQMRHADQIHFDLGEGGMFGRRTVGVTIHAAMCTDCGHIEMRGDIEALRRLEVDAEPADTPRRAVG